MTKQLAIVLSLLCLLAAVSSAHASATFPATFGRAAGTDSDTCYLWFDLSGASTGLTRTCVGAGYVDIAVPLVTQGTKNVSVWAKRPSGVTGTLSCQTVSYTKTGAYIPGSFVAAAVSTSFAAIVLPAVTVSAQGGLFVRCQLPKSMSILQVEVDVP